MKSTEKHENDRPFDWKGRTVLVTGGTGSFGKMFTRIMLDEFQPEKLIILSRDELKQHEMRNSGFDHPNMRYFIGDVRDADRLAMAFSGVDVVVHAAALKQVPACEYNPIEAIQTNILGGRSVIDAALRCGVARVLALSTDKAVNPATLYGATKLCAEKLFIQSNAYSGKSGTRFSCVRYGNVLGSRGSVVPLFKEQKKAGCLTITDKRMTRFWMTLEQGVRFVISCIEDLRGGEVFVPKIPSMTVTDLARAIAPECETEEIGRRPAEKLHEALLSEEEIVHTLEFADRFVVQPAHPWWTEEISYTDGKPLPDDFQYTSDQNSEWLSLDEIRKMAGVT